jgi:hypothetical protein
MMDQDSMFVHKSVITYGKTGERVVRGFNNAAFLKPI